jgi:hypothetical protein
MKGLLYIVCLVVLIVQSLTFRPSKNRTISANNYTNSKCYFKPIRYKPISSFVKKAKRIKVITALATTKYESKYGHLEGDDLGGDYETKYLPDDALLDPLHYASFLESDQHSYDVLTRKYSHFLHFHWPPPQRA